MRGLHTPGSTLGSRLSSFTLPGLSSSSRPRTSINSFSFYRSFKPSDTRFATSAASSHIQSLSVTSSVTHHSTRWKPSNHDAIVWSQKAHASTKAKSAALRQEIDHEEFGSGKEPLKKEKTEEELDQEEEADFGRSDKANAASQLDLSAKLSKEGSKSAKRPAFNEVWRLLKIAGPEMKTLSGAFSLLLVSSSVSLSIPWAIGKIMDLANNNQGGQITLFGLEPSTFYTGFGALLFLGASANFGRVILLRIVGERIVAGLRSKLYRRTMMQNAEFFDANRVGDLLSRLGSDTTIVGKAITQNLSDGLRAMVSGGAGVAMMTWTSPHLTSVLLIMLPPFAACAYFFGRAIRNLSRIVQRNLGTLTKIAEERLGNVKTTQAFVGEAPELGRYNKQVKKIFTLGKRDALLNASFFGTTGFLGNMTILALLYVGGGMVQSGAITVGQLSSFLLYAGFAGSSLFGLSGFFSELMKGSGAASRIFELQDRDPAIYPTTGTAVRSARGPIEFKNVVFSYPTRPAVKIFEDLNFKIHEGSNVAIVAPSGAGKSTVAQLLLRFYAPNTGTITIDGKDVSQMNAKQLRRRIGYVGQEPVLFSGSVAENIAYGRPSATRIEVIHAAKKANCHFISDFPEGLDTQVGARGAQLSGGQKQRIAIARALLKNPDILILDEATSALDAESESLVNEALAALLRGNNTTISIAHRLSTIKRSDRVIVIGGDGRVAEEGSYYELSRNKDGAFNQLMQWQMSGDSEPPKKVEPRPSELEDIEFDLESEDGGEAEEVEVERKTAEQDRGAQ